MLTSAQLAGRLPALVQTASGVFATMLGLVVIVGWQTGSATVTQVRPDYAAMQYVNALAFVLAGVGLLSAVAGRDGTAGIAGLLTGAIGVLSLTQDLLHVDPRVDLLFGVTEYLASLAAPPARMPPNAAICFGLVGAALFMRRAGGTERMSMATSLLGSTTAALGLVAIVGYASDLAPAYGWGRLTRMAVHTAMGLVVVGSGLVASGWRDSPVAGGAVHRIPTLVGVASLTATIAVWHALVVHDRQRTMQLIRMQAAYLGAIVSEPLERHARALEQMALWSESGLATREQWTRDAARQLAHFPAAHTLTWIDIGSNQRWEVPAREGRAQSAHAADSARGAAVAGRKTVVTGAVDLDTGVKGLLMAVPVVRSDAVHAVVTSAVRFDRLVERALSSQTGLAFEAALLDGVRPVYGQIGQVSDEWMTDVEVGLRGAPLRLRVRPTPGQLASLEGRMPSLILAGGLLLSAVLACLTYFAGAIRRREGQLREAAHQLREEARERKRTDAELARARDAALESDRLKSEFVANVSHELRTPLNGIMGLTELLLDSDLTAEQRHHAVTVRDCGDTLLALLNDILDLSKVAAGKLEIQTVPFEPRHLVQQTADLFAERARAKRVNLVCLVHHEVPESVEGDPGRFRQILMNLLGNAVKFTEEGEITVRVSCEKRGERGIGLRVEVTDTGIGISPEAQQQIFQPFVQADGSITRKYGGTGLGLVISRQLADLMGGEMGMTSQPGQGSTFWFTVQVMPAISPQPRREPDARGLRGLRVLVLDDSDSSRQRLCAQLQSWRMQVSAETTPERGLQVLREASEIGQPFDLVIVDFRGVGTSELDFAQAAQATGLAPPLRIILLSGRGQRGDAQRAWDLGASAYLSKPVTDVELFECLSTVMAAGPPQGVAPGALVTRHTLVESRKGLQKPTLLVVEDNIVNQKVLIGFLNKLGYRADVAANGYEALHALQHAPYPLVLMDSQMPEMDGFATTAEIRRREGNTRRTTIVAVTAHAMKGERERCLAAGMDDYLSKPISLDRLAAVLDRWLTDAAAAPQMPARSSAASAPAGADPPIDTRVLDQLRELEADVPGLVVDVLSTFLRETPGRIAAVLEAVERCDCAGIERAAHGLKGSAGAVGATRLAQLSAEIERAGREAALSDCETPARALEEEFRQARAILQRDYLPSGVA